jgi:serine/threonine-protein kinase
VLGPVFRTYEPQRDRLIAVKAFRLDIVPEDVARLADALRRLVAAGIAHPNLVPVIDAGLEGTTAYLAMEYVAGETLDVALRHIAPAPLDRALTMLGPIAEALDAAWASGWGHGSLHVRDVFLAPGSAEVLVSGAGIVAALESVGIKPPIRRPYAAPERVAGEACDARADVYALGAIAHEILTRRRPAGPGEQDGALATTVSPERRVLVRRVLSSALASDPAHRFATATAFVEALAAIERGEDPTARLPELASSDDRETPAATLIAPALDLPAVAAPAPLANAAEEWSSPSPTRTPAPASLFDAPTRVHHTLDFERAPDDDVLPPPVEVPQAGADDFPAFPDEGAAPPVPDTAAPTVVYEPASADLADESPMRSVLEREFEPARQFEAEPEFEPRRDPDPAPEPPERFATFASRPRAEERETTRALGSILSAGPDFVPTRFPWGAVVAAALAGIALGGVGGYQFGLSRGGPAGAAPPPAVATAPPATATPGRVGAPGDTDVTVPPAPDPSRTQAAQQAPSPASVARTTRGRLAIRTVPTGGLVSLNGQTQGVAPQTIGDLPLGEHSIQVARPGYRTATQRVTLTADEPSRDVTVRLVRAAAPRPSPPPATTGFLTVNTRPAGARVFVDGRVVGQTPLSRTSLSPGSHPVRIEMTGYRTISTTIVVKAGEVTPVSVSLERGSGLYF